MDKLFRSVPMSVTKADGEGDNLTFIISTSTPDRDQDILEPKGCQLKNYKKNSVVLFAHDYHSLPIGKSVNITTLDDHIEAEVQFAPTRFAQEVRVLCEQGFLNAASVGFIPIKAEPIEDEEGDELRGCRKGQRFKVWDLLEWSIVPVPSNFEALIQNAKAKGIAVDALEEEMVKEPLAEVEITAFDDRERVYLDPSTGEKRTEPFEDPAAGDEGEAEIDENEAEIASESDVTDDADADILAFDDAADTLTIADTDAFKEIRLSALMAEKIIVTDGIGKAGRVLSAANEKKIKGARDSLTEVLDQLEDQDKSVETEQYLKCPKCQKEISPPFDEIIKNEWECPDCKNVIPVDQRWAFHKVKAEPPTLEELVERLEVAAGMIVQERAAAETETYIDFDIKKPAQDDSDVVLVDMDELAEAIRSSIKPEISKLRQDVTGKIG